MHEESIWRKVRGAGSVPTACQVMHLLPERKAPFTSRAYVPFHKRQTAELLCSLQMRQQYWRACFIIIHMTSAPHTARLSPLFSLLPSPATYQELPRLSRSRKHASASRYQTVEQSRERDIRPALSLCHSLNGLQEGGLRPVAANCRHPRQPLSKVLKTSGLEQHAGLVALAA